MKVPEVKSVTVEYCKRYCGSLDDSTGDNADSGVVVQASRLLSDDPGFEPEFLRTAAAATTAQKRQSKFGSIVNGNAFNNCTYDLNNICFCPRTRTVSPVRDGHDP